MKSGLSYNLLQEAFSRSCALATGGEPYPLHSWVRCEQDRLSPASVLDIGCGNGRFALEGTEYVGVDPNPKYIDYCRRHRRGRFEQMSGERLDFPDRTFSMVLFFSVGHHLTDPMLDRTLAEASRVLADDGTLLFADVVRPIAGHRWASALLEWLDEGNSFRTEQEYRQLLMPYFAAPAGEVIIDQFYRTLTLACRKA